MKRNSISHENNFNLIRLLAALQVVVWHSNEHLNLGINDRVIDFISYFPGVPIFFTISGFLIINSYYRNSDIRQYTINRLLRIYPALWVSLIFTIILLIIFGILNMSNIFSKSFLAYLLTQISFFQFYTPDILRSWGVGTPNGSLWTIVVELQFYLILPFLANLIRKNELFIYLFMGLSLLINILLRVQVESVFIKLIRVSILPYFFYFLIGIVAYKYWAKIKKNIIGKGMYWLSLYFIYILITNYLGLYKPSYNPNFYGFLGNLILSGLILSLAYSKVKLTNKILGNNDFSYGMYIYHMIIVNSVLSIDYLNNKFLNFIIVLVSTILLSYLSWNFIEYPILNIKKKIYTKIKGKI